MLRFKFTIWEWVLFFLLVYTWFFPSFRDHYTKVLIDAPITFSPPGIIETSVNVPFSETYSLEFHVERNADTVGQVAYLIGNGGNTPPIKPIPLEVNVYSLPDMNLIFNKKVSYLSEGGWVSLGERIEANLFTTIDLLPGSYRIATKSLESLPFSKTVTGQLEIAGGVWRNGEKETKSEIIKTSRVVFDVNGRFGSQCDIQIKEKGGYYFSFQLSDEAEKLFNAIGGGRAVGRENVGTPIPVSLQIYSLPDNRLVSKKNIIARNQSAGARDYVAVKIDNIILPEGDYKFIIQISSDIPSLADLKAKVIMDLNGKFSSSTWQMAHINYGVFLYPIVLVVDVVLFIFVLYRRAKARLNTIEKSE